MNRNLTDEDAKAIGRYMADELFELLQNEQKMEMITSAWTKSVDRRVGATIRRAVWMFFLGVGLVVALKIESLLATLKSV